MFAVHLREDREQIGPAAVGDPHLLPVEHIVRPVGAEVGARLSRQRVGARMRFRQAIGAHQLGRRKPWQILRLLRFGAEQEQR